MTSGLAEYDLDDNSWIDENDAIFNELSILGRDEQGNEMMQSLLDAEISAICLANTDSPFSFSSDAGDFQGQMKDSGIYLTEDGEVQSIHQVDLADKKAIQENVNAEEMQNPEQSEETEDHTSRLTLSTASDFPGQRCYLHRSSQDSHQPPGRLCRTDHKHTILLPLIRFIISFPVIVIYRRAL
ncbi:MAG: hypothetical protein KQH63_06300 [Desulfobulbaceae bacterium]|nr:hypothetical protein [Desulfobulbaceae bacterium]